MIKNNILIIKHGSLGDIIRCDGIIRSIKKFHTNSRIILMTSNRFVSLMSKNPLIDNIIVDDRVSLFNIKYFINLKRKLIKYSPILIYDLQNSQRTLLYKKFLLPDFKWISTRMEKHPISGIQGLADMLKKNNIPYKDALETNLSWLTNDVRNILKSKKIKKNYILIIPGSSKSHPEKRWPFFPQLINLLIKKKYEVLSILGPDESNIIDMIPGKKLINLNWGDLAGIINKSSFVISNDTGPVHIAACMKKRGIIIFGPSTSSTRVGLSNDNFIIKENENLAYLKPDEVLNDLINSFHF
jgi:ADP-heptose:LPS heptosyltransferase